MKKQVFESLPIARITIGKKQLRPVRLHVLHERARHFDAFQGISTLVPGAGILLESEHAVMPTHVRCNQPFAFDYILFDENRKAVSAGWLPAAHDRPVFVQSFSAKYILLLPEHSIRSKFHQAQANQDDVSLIL